MNWKLQRNEDPRALCNRRTKGSIYAIHVLRTLWLLAWKKLKQKMMITAIWIWSIVGFRVYGCNAPSMYGLVFVVKWLQTFPSLAKVEFLLQLGSNFKFFEVISLGFAVKVNLSLLHGPLTSESIYTECNYVLAMDRTGMVSSSSLLQIAKISSNFKYGVNVHKL